jgi:AhpD family alkylhydroperoxidase
MNFKEFSPMSTISMPSANGRLQHRKVIPEAVGALGAVNATLEDSTLGMRLIDLVRQRISQINGCAYCVDSHARDLLTGGEDLQRLNSLGTWREVTLFTERERAALNWAESLTLLPQTQAPDEDFDALAAYFNEREIAELTMAAALMNAWNRIGVGLRVPVRAVPLKVPAA